MARRNGSASTKPRKRRFSRAVNSSKPRTRSRKRTCVCVACCSIDSPTFEAQHNWEQPDWRNVITAVREARQLWREHSPVDPAAAEQLQGRFNELTTALQGRIDAEYARNVKEKKSLIERARALAGSPETRKAIDEVKRLQEQWKVVGPVSRDDDRKLWEEFRKQCDALFQKRQQEFATQNAALDSNKSQAVSLCEELEKIAELSGQELLDGAKSSPSCAMRSMPSRNCPKPTRANCSPDSSAPSSVVARRWLSSTLGTRSRVGRRCSMRRMPCALIDSAVVRNAGDADALKQTAEAQLSSSGEVAQARTGRVEARRSLSRAAAISPRASWR